jgi:DNA-binding transcriptional LysR family regulator
MEFNQLRYLRSAVRTGSITGAAEAEFVSQPSISKQIRSLENELGVPLFHRVGRGIVPTEAATMLADFADRLFDDLSRTVSAVSGPDSVSGGTLRICATETVANHLLPPALASLKQRYPHCRIRVEMLGGDDALEQVRADEVDFAILPLPVVDSRLEVSDLLEEDVLLAVPVEHAWAGRSEVPIAEVLAQPSLLLSMPGLGLRTLVDEAAQTLGMPVAQGIELRSQVALLALVAEGAGIAFAPRMSLERRLDVAAVQLNPPLTRKIGWVKRRGRHVPAIGQELLRILGSEIGT